MPDRIRRRAVVEGRVQGVFFRASIRERAEARGVAGWARNRSDGSVEAVLEGSPDDVDQVVEFLRTGPPRAEVTNVEVTAESPEGLAGFDLC